MTKQEFVAKKIPILMNEGKYSRQQAIAIAFSMFDKEGQKAQGGGQWYENNPPMSSTDYGQTLPQLPTTQNVPNQGETFGSGSYNKSQYSSPTNTEGLAEGYEYDASGKVVKKQNTQNSVNIMNPFGGISMDYALNFAGEGFGSGNYGQAAVGTGLSLLKGARNFLTGFSTGKENKRVGQEYFNNQFADNRNFTYRQQGGNYKNSDIIAQNAIVDNPQSSNVNLEGNEFVMRNDGQVQPVVGDKHIENGKKADGVNAQLEDGDKVLSNYVKLKPNDIKDLKDRYDISLKKGVTFADAQKKLDQKLGIKKLETEKADILEKIEKATKIKDSDTKQLSLEVLTKKTGDVNEKLNTLSGVRADNFEFLFTRQEAQPKLGSGTELYDKNGKEVTESKEEVAQQGMQYSYQKSGDRAIAQQDVDRINKNTSIQFTPDFAKSYFSTASTPIAQQQTTDYSQMPVLDITSDGQWTDRKVWRTQRPEWFVGKQEPMEGRDYTVVPYKQWGEYQKGQEYQKFSGNNQQLAEMQQGGKMENLAKKHGISMERAQELMSYQQQGGAQQEVSEQDQMQQVFQAVAEMLQQGMQPEQVAEQLIQMGVPEEQVGQLIQEVAQQLQGQSSAEEQMEGQYSNEQEEGMEVAQQGGGYSFSTRVTPELQGYDTQGTSVLNQDTLSDVEEWQPYTGKGYGAKMANIEDTIKVHDWYFNTEEKKKVFREAAIKEGKQSEIEEFQKAYNSELENRAKKAGLSESDTNNIKQQVGFSDKGVQKVDGLFGAFTSTRPLYSFLKKDGEIEAKVEATPNVQTQQTIETKNNVKNIMPNFGSYIPLFSPMSPIAKETINIPRMDAIKTTAEPYLAEQERQRLTDVERIEQAGMSPQQTEALLAQGLSSSQMASNDAIAKVEQYNAQNQFQTDQYNLGARSKEDIMNAQFRQNFQGKVLQTLANQEESMRNQYRSNFLQEQANANKVINMNTANALNDNFAVTPSGVEFLNNKPYELPNNTLELLKNYDKMTPAERIAFIKSHSKLA